MYKITYIHKDETTERPLYQPGSDTYCLLDATLSLEAGKSGELTVSIPDANPAKADIVCLTDEIIFYRDDVELWRGRPVTWQNDFNRTGELTCEGVLSYLFDTWYPPYDFQGSPNDLIADVLAKHNARVEDRKKIYVGNITVSDPNDYITRSNSDYSRSLNVLSDKLVAESLGGYLRIRVVDGIKYLDYLDGYGTTATQPIQLGVNLLDLAETVEYGDTISAVLPLGAADEETGKRLTVESVNGWDLYVSDAALVAQYGWIAEVVEWDDVTVAANLLTKAREYLQQAAAGVRSLTINAVDLSVVSDAYTAINLGDMVLIQSEPHGVNLYMELTSMEIHPLDPASDTLNFGAQTAAYTEQSASAERQFADSLNSVTTIVKNLSANTITADYLAANYATITALTATNVAVEKLKAADAEIQQAIIDKASVEDLTATNATLTNVTADVADISALLAGSAGVGNLQAIHLTGDNVVIDDAIITDAMIAGLTAGKLTAGTIWTNLVTIASQSGNLSIVDNTIQIVDDAGTVRVQIGKDAAGDYNLALWGTDGDLLWDASGVYAAGLHDGIIKDVAIADDANINQSKIDMQSVAERLNEDGSITVDAGRVTIDDTTLDVAYRSVTTKIDDSVTHVEIQYALSPSQTVSPEDGWAVITPEPQEGQYLWQKTVTTYGNGSIEESLPTCLSGMAGKDGEDATVLRIDSSRGTVFKNSAVSTVLSVVIYHGSLRITDKAGLTAAFGSGAYLEWSWQRMDESTFGVISAGDSRITNDGFCFTLSPDDVDTKVVFQCSLNI